MKVVLKSRADGAGVAIFAPLGLYHVDAAVVVHCHARGVIAAVLQLLQAIEQNGRRLLLSDISYNAAHDNQSFLIS